MFVSLSEVLCWEVTQMGDVFFDNHDFFALVVFLSYFLVSFFCFFLATSEWLRPMIWVW